MNWLLDDTMCPVRARLSFFECARCLDVVYLHGGHIEQVLQFWSERQVRVSNALAIWLAVRDECRSRVLLDRGLGVVDYLRC